MMIDKFCPNLVNQSSFDITTSITVSRLVFAGTSLRQPCCIHFLVCMLSETTKVSANFKLVVWDTLSLTVKSNHHDKYFPILLLCVSSVFSCVLECECILVRRSIQLVISVSKYNSYSKFNFSPPLLLCIMIFTTCIHNQSRALCLLVTKF